MDSNCFGNIFFRLNGKIGHIFSIKTKLIKILITKINLNKNFNVISGAGESGKSTIVKQMK